MATNRNKEYKEYKKVLESMNFNMCESEFHYELNKFLLTNSNIKIEHIIEHGKYNITLIYSYLKEVEK